MQLRVWTAATIFMGSYLPLSLILLVQDFDYSYLRATMCWDFWSDGTHCVVPLGHPGISLSVFGLCLLSFVFTLFVLRVTKLKRSVKIVSASHVPAELMNYTLPYVVSFMGVGYNETGKFIGVLIFLGWMFWISFKTGQIMLNPILSVIGWRLYEIEYNFIGSRDLHKTSALVIGDLTEPTLANYNYIQDIMIARIKPESQEV